MTELKSSLENHHKQYQKRNTTLARLQDAMSPKDMENWDLVRTITDLRAQNTKLTTELDRNKWACFRNKPPEDSAVHIGSSVIRDIDRNKLLNTDIKCLTGAKIIDMTREVVQLTNDKYRRIVLVGEGNVCSDTKEATVVANNFKYLFITVKLKAVSVTVARIFRRGDRELQGCNDDVNTAVQGICIL